MRMRIDRIELPKPYTGAAILAAFHFASSFRTENERWEPEWNLGDGRKKFGENYLCARVRTLIQPGLIDRYVFAVPPSWSAPVHAAEIKIYAATYDDMWPTDVFPVQWHISYEYLVLNGCATVDGRRIQHHEADFPYRYAYGRIRETFCEILKVETDAPEIQP
jgi:hypothetical protein